jgi:hypothetical protein
MRKGLIIVFMAIAGILFPGTNGVHAIEQVVKLRRSYHELSNQVFCDGEAVCNDFLFDVYTVQEMNAIRDDLKGQIDATTRQGGIVDQRINAAEARLRDQLKHSLDAIPQIVLSEQTKDAIKTAVLDAEKDELNQIRRDIQGQIDELKSQIEKLKRIKNK